MLYYPWGLYMCGVFHQTHTVALILSYQYHLIHQMCYLFFTTSEINYEKYLYAQIINDWNKLN